MKNARATEPIEPYIEKSLPRLFDETKKLLDSAERKIARGSDLHSRDIGALRDVFYEESLDAKSLGRLVRCKTSAFSGEWDERLWKSECASETVARLAADARSAVTATLERTSMGSAFFTSSLTYFEEYESRYGYSKSPGLEQETLFQLIGEDFERAKGACRSVNESVGEIITPIQGGIAYHANAGNMDEVAKLTIERSVLAERLRKNCEPIMETIVADFEKLRLRAAKHGYKLSFAWD